MTTLRKNLVFNHFYDQNLFNLSKVQQKLSATLFKEHTYDFEFLNDKGNLEKYVNTINESLQIGDVFEGKAKLNAYFKSPLYSKGFWGRFIYLFSFLFHRVLPKFNKITQSFYFFITKGKNQRLAKAEVIGLFIKNGFKIESLMESDGILYFLVAKRENLKNYESVSLGPIFKMKRTGLNGVPIVVYKLRTMHAYSEFVQEYVREMNGLDASGKFSNDFRITSWGRILRKYWIDEIPMLLNLIRGDIKLIGVRPISFNYLKLYPLDFQAKRRCFKPGLIPPYYADLPKNFNQIIDSELRYLQHYEKQPFLTDLKYMAKILNNIILKKSRSK